MLIIYRWLTTKDQVLFWRVKHKNRNFVLWRVSKLTLYASKDPKLTLSKSIPIFWLHEVYTFREPNCFTCWEWFNFEMRLFSRKDSCIFWWGKIVFQGGSLNYQLWLLSHWWRHNSHQNLFDKSTWVQKIPIDSIFLCRVSVFLLEFHTIFYLRHLIDTPYLRTAIFQLQDLFLLIRIFGTNC